MLNKQIKKTHSCFQQTLFTVSLIECYPSPPYLQINIDKQRDSQKEKAVGSPEKVHKINRNNGSIHY